VSKPIRHPETGIYQFRKRVPRRLRAIVGKREEKVSLRTRDLQEALIRYAVAERKCLSWWRSLEAGVVDLTVKQCRAIAGELCRERIAEFEDHVEDPDPWRKELLRLERERTALTEHFSPPPDLVADLLCRPALDAFLARNGIVASAATRLRLLRVATDAFEKAAAHLENAARGIYADPGALPFPPLSVLRTSETGVPLLTVWQSYIRERGVADATKKRWLPVLTKFAAFAGTDDFARISRQKILDWKAHLLESDLEPRTIADVHLAAVKALFGHAYRDNKIAENPAERIGLAYRSKPRTRDQGYTRDEAYFVLDSCRSQDTAVYARDRAATLRWVPWICAYTGARIGEITQMRPCDIYCSGRDMAMMKITPEAGRQKAGSYRDVAIHSHLLAQGFLEYVLACGSAPLFYDPARARGEPDPAKLSAKSGEWLAAWIRSNCIKDRRIAPNHAWRHRFKSNSRTIGMREDFAELIMGHAPNGASRLYGNYWPVLSRRQMELQMPYAIPGMSLLEPEVVSAQIARLPRLPKDSLQPKEDAEKLEFWLRSFRIPDLELPAMSADGVGSADFGA
jgi:integrase